MIKFPYYRQYDQMDCGPTCLRMVAKYYGRHYTMDTLRQKSGINREGVSLLGISEAAEQIGFRTVGAKLTWEQLKKEAALPCVVYWNQVHFYSDPRPLGAHAQRRGNFRHELCDVRQHG